MNNKNNNNLNKKKTSSGSSNKKSFLNSILGNTLKNNKSSNKSLNKLSNKSNNFNLNKSLKNLNKNINNTKSTKSTNVSSIKKSSNNSSQKQIIINSSSSKKYNIPKYIKIIIIVLLVVMILYFFYIFISDFINSSKNTPYLVDSIIDATVPKIINGSSIPQSFDGRYGREFSYSFWIYIKNSNYGYNTVTSCASNEENENNNLKLKHIFHKGSAGIDTTCATSSTVKDNIDASFNNLPLLQYPGVWLDSNTNDLIFNVNTHNTPNNYEKYKLTNIPIDKWVHITFILINNNIDLYVNCNLKKRYTLDGVPKINYGNFFIANYGGFMGYLSKLRYYNYALEPFTIMNLCKEMPDDVSNVNSDASVEPPYLANDYWFNN